MSSGMSLVELMVAVTIALVMSLAIFSALAGSEGKKRSLTSTNDVGQAGTFAAYQLDKLIRSAGSGFSQSANFTYGCQVKANLAAAGVILPNTSSMAPPFTTLNTQIGGNYRLAPAIIVKNATTPNVTAAGNGTSDALIIMSGSAGFGEVPTLFTTPATPTLINLQNTISFKAGDLIMITDTASATGPVDCMIEQVATRTPTSLTLGGNYYANPIVASTLTNYSTVAMALNLGSSAPDNPPSFSIIGVGDFNSLISYDLLQMGTPNSVSPIGDGILEMHALYGVDTIGDGLVHRWIDPGVGYGYDFVSLEDGSPASVDKLKRIKALRVGLILRTALPEKITATPTTAGPLRLFTDLDPSVWYVRNLVATETNFRYRTLEMTIPLRNTLP